MSRAAVNCSSSASRVRSSLHTVSVTCWATDTRQRKSGLRFVWRLHVSQHIQTGHFLFGIQKYSLQGCGWFIVMGTVQELLLSNSTKKRKGQTTWRKPPWPLKCIVLSLKHLHPNTCSHSQVCLDNCLDGDFIYGLLLWFSGSIQSKFLFLMNHNLNLMVSP